MRKSLHIYFALFLVVFAMKIVNAQTQPTFNLSVRNVQFTDSIGTGGYSDDAMTFDIMIEHTNLEASGPFEFALGSTILM
ncbi:MAG: hypothetical protein IPN57_13200 [Ignavibacteria bacterium]|nr:hypothetical protein [Ignavibacteria bacterium]